MVGSTDEGGPSSDGVRHIRAQAATDLRQRKLFVCSLFEDAEACERTHHPVQSRRVSVHALSELVDRQGFPNEEIGDTQRRNHV
jgi:hypothetical protein